MEDLYTVNEVASNVYSISENITDRPVKFAQQLVVGSKKAAIIDASIGIDDGVLKQIRKITDKPLICLLTHGDPDHTGGAGVFDDVYMNPADDAMMKAGINPEFRLHAIDVASGHNQELVAHMQKEMPQTTTLNYTPILDGDTFDLGGITLQVVGIPGHSSGSMCFVDAEHHIGFTGDGVATMNMAEIYDERCDSLTTWGESLKKLQMVLGGDVTLFSGHRTDAFPDGMLSALIKAVADIKAGDTKNDTPITNMPTGKVADNDKMQPRAHQIAGTPYIVMYNALNI